MEDKGISSSTLESSTYLKEDQNMDANVTNRIERVFNRYEDKDAIKYVCLSKKLYKYLGKPETVCDLEVIVDNELYNLAYFFCYH